MTDGTTAFTAFVDARYAALVRTAFLMIGDRALAEDAVQSALIKTLGSWDRLADPAAAEGYTRTILVRLVARQSRRRWHGEVPTSSPPDTSTDAVDTVITSLDVRAALGRLPWDQRATLVLRYFDDLSERDVAEVLRCSVGTVKSRTSRALTALRSAGLLDDRQDHEPEAHHG